LTGVFDKTAKIPTSAGLITVKTSDKTTVENQIRGGNPNVSISAYTVLASTDPRVTTATGVAHTSNFSAVNGLKFTEYGAWTIDQSTASPAPIYVGAYGGGAPGFSPSTSVPTTGSATFSGGATGYISQANNTNTLGTLGTFYGNVRINANFVTGALSGNITGINAFGLGNNNRTLIGTINDISLAGNLAGNSYTGTATAGSNIGTGFDISGSAGSLAGALFGPNAVETAGTFTLSGGTNNVSVIGGFGATSAAPSDRRLKTDINLLLIRADGLKLYSWRYRGSQRRHVGPIAQELLQDIRFSGHVGIDGKGFYWVDFAGLDFIPSNLDIMRTEGRRAIALTVQ
jgi:hypothetical protein